jgi:hypothetical protein
VTNLASLTQERPLEARSDLDRVVNARGLAAATSRPGVGLAEPVIGNRPPGRPKGYPKTGGRKSGTSNRITREIREIAQKYTRRALLQAWKLAQKAENEDVRLKALALILAYAHGKPTDRQEISGPEGKPLTTAVPFTPEEITARKALWARLAASTDKGAE